VKDYDWVANVLKPRASFIAWRRVREIVRSQRVERADTIKRYSKDQNWRANGRSMRWKFGRLWCSYNSLWFGRIKAVGSKETTAEDKIVQLPGRRRELIGLVNTSAFLRT